MYVLRMYTLHYIIHVSILVYSTNYILYCCPYNKRPCSYILYMPICHIQYCCTQLLYPITIHNVHSHSILNILLKSNVLYVHITHAFEKSVPVH